MVHNETFGYRVLHHGYLLTSFQDTNTYLKRFDVINLKANNNKAFKSIHFFLLSVLKWEKKTNKKEIQVVLLFKIKINLDLC